MKNLYKALAAFQQEVPNIYKNSQGYGYKFADLGEINDVIKPILKKHGLGYVQPLSGTGLKTIVFHVESGESIESIVEIPQDVQLAKMNTFQVVGSGITYYRRYSLSSMLGLITDEDADAAGEQVKTTKAKTYTPSTTAKATDQQKMFIANLLRQHGKPDSEMKEYLADNYGIIGDMSQADAQMVIDDLNTKEK
jgi:hypothetical protein